MDTETEKEKRKVFRDQGIDRYEGMLPSDLFDELYDPRSDMQLAANPERIAMVREMVAGLSAEAKEVVDIVVNAPSELAEHIRRSGMGMSQASIRDYLRYRDWGFPDINRVFQEIRDFLKKF